MLEISLLPQVRTFRTILRNPAASDFNLKFPGVRQNTFWSRGERAFVAPGFLPVYGGPGDLSREARHLLLLLMQGHDISCPSSALVVAARGFDSLLLYVCVRL